MAALILLIGEGYRLPGLPVAEAFTRTEHPRTLPMAIEVADAEVTEHRTGTAQSLLPAPPPALDGLCGRPARYRTRGRVA